MWGMGMGMGMGMMTDQIIIDNNNMYVNDVVIVDQGMGMGMGMNEVIVVDNGYRNNNQVIIVDNGYGGYGGYGQEVIIVDNYNQYPNKHHHHHHKNNNNYNYIQTLPVQQQQQIYVRQQTNFENYPTIPTYQSKKQQKKQIQDQVIVCNTMLELMYGKWLPSKQYPLSQIMFHQIPICKINKIKCRTELKPYSDDLHMRQIIMKVVTDGEQEFYFAAIASALRDYFYHLTLIKLRARGTILVKIQGQISGMIYRKFGLFGGWQCEHVKITPGEGLKAYKNPCHKHNLHIKSVKELWTRFQIVQGAYMVIKLKHSGTKYEFGVPLNHLGPWVDAFFTLLEKYD